jgi:hypothetical protein
MGTIGLAHRPHRDFVVDWLEPEVSATDPDEGLTRRVEVVRARARSGDLERTPGSGAAPEDARQAGDEAWLAGEPTF